MNYFDKITDRLAEILPDCDADLLRYYTLLALTRGMNTSLENVHDAWSAWRTVTKPDHKSLIPFKDLTPEIQEYYRKYMDAIHKVTYELIFDTDQKIMHDHNTTVPM